MASAMGLHAGLVGPKSGSVEKVLVLKSFLKGQRGEEHSNGANKYPRRTVWEGDGKPSHLWACLRFSRFGGFVACSGNLHA